MFRNHHQIYTHCEELGVIIGQYWRGPGFWGRVTCITEKGYVRLDTSPKLSAHRPSVHLSKLVTTGQMIAPVMINPYKQWLTGKTHLQVLAFDIHFTSEEDITYYTFGELRRNYVPLEND